MSISQWFDFVFSPFVLWFHLIGTALVCVVAVSKKRSWAWSLTSLLLAGPILCLLALAAMPSRADR